MSISPCARIGVCYNVPTTLDSAHLKMSGCPTRNLDHFWAALSKMSLIFSKFLGRLRRHTQCPLSLVSSPVSSSCLLLWPWLRSLSQDIVRCTLCSVWHGCLYQWSLDSLKLHKAINTEQSRKQRKQNTEENEDVQK